MKYNEKTIKLKSEIKQSRFKGRVNKSDTNGG